MTIVNLKIIKRYSKSLYHLSIELNNIKNIYNEIDKVYSLLLESHDLMFFFKSPILNIKSKQKIAKTIFYNFSLIVQNFIFLLIKYRRENYIKEIIEEFNKLYNIHNQIVKVYITTACIVNTSFINKIIHNSGLIKKTSTIVINHIVNADIIGGYILFVENKQINCTIQSKLLKLKKKFFLD